MFIAHLPAGYLLTRWISQRALRAPEDSLALPALVLVAGLLGSIFPDFDLAWWLWVDHRQSFHHEYWSHFPVTWIVPALLALVWLAWGRQRLMATAAFSFCMGGVLHMVLDSSVGGIHWLAPWSDHSFSLDRVTARFQPWWLNFMMHWSFALEIILVAWGWHRASTDCKARLIRVQMQGAKS